MTPHHDPADEPWSRHSGETSPAWEAFRTYRDMGPSRSTAKVAQQLGKSKTLMDRWSARNKWVLRACAWDADQDRQFVVEMADERRKAARRAVQLVNVMTAAASRAAVELLNSPLRPMEVARLGEAAARIQQTALALEATPGKQAPSRGTSPHGEVADALSDEGRRERMRRLRAELNARLGDTPDL